MGFTFYRILCSTPGELEAEREVFESAVTSFCTDVTFPEGVLWTPASFRAPFEAARNIAAVESNLRMVDAFIQIVGEGPLEAPFLRFVRYGFECLEKDDLPLRAMAVFTKNGAAVGDDIAAMADKLNADPRCQLRSYSDLEDLRSQLRDVFAGWYAARTA